MTRGAWRVARGVWRVARGAWRVARGAWRMVRQSLIMKLGQCLVEISLSVCNLRLVQIAFQVADTQRNVYLTLS